MRMWWLGALALLGACATEPSAETPATVAAVELPRYLGTWYEAARLPMWAQDRDGVVCEATSATYTARPDGQISVLNRCTNAVDGQERAATGTAYAVAGSANARLRVSFFWPFYGDYWVLGLDPEYRWAVVGSPSRQYLWILSRARRMDPAEYARAVEIARARGIDVTKLRVTQQPST